MEAATEKKLVWAGRAVSALPGLGLILSAIMKLTHNPKLVEGFTKGGWQESSLTSLGVLELTCALLYLIPQTAVLGAILVTGYLGGAVATHVRIGEPFTAPLLLGILVWVGLYLRDPRLRALLPLRR